MSPSLQTAFYVGVAALLIPICGAHAQAPPENSVTILAEPIASFDLVVARVVGARCSIDPQKVRVRQSGSVIRVDTRGNDTCIPTNGSDTVDVSVGRFPAGQFSVDVFVSEAQKVATAQFVVVDNSELKASHHPLVDYTDHWWNPQESGWGMSIMQHTSDKIFAVWYVYDQAMKPIWYTLQPGSWLSFNQYAGPVYKTTGPYFSGPFNSANVGITQVGTATLTFPNYATGTFSYTIDGVPGIKAISRMAF